MWLTSWLRRLRRHAADASADAAGLVECEWCGRDYANPVAWRRSDDRQWWIRIRCGACEFVRDVVVDDATARRFDRELEDGMRLIADDLSRIRHEGVDAAAAEHSR